MKPRSFAWLPTVLLAIFVFSFFSGFRTPRYHSSFNIAGFSRLPVLNGGRLKPIDTVARTALLELSGKQTVKADGGNRLSAVEWLLDVLYRPQLASRYAVFQIDDPDVLGFLGIEQKQQRLFTYANVASHADAIEEQAKEAEQIKPEKRSRFQSAIENLQSRLTLYEKLQNTLQIAGTDQVQSALHRFQEDLVPLLRAHLSGKGGTGPRGSLVMKELDAYRFLGQAAEFYPVPLSDADKNPNRWVSWGMGALTRLDAPSFPAAVSAYAALGDAWRAGDPLVFNQVLAPYQKELGQTVPRAARKARVETLFNTAEPFYQSLLVYLVVFILVFLSWIVWPEALNRSAYVLLLWAFSVHTAGLLTRIILQGRPPVTNLYSSAIFVGWIAVLLGLCLERLYKSGIGSMVASTIGFITLIIAHHLASTGDTLEMMRAVLDSNFWLATHVVSITVGYGSTFLAGFLGILFIFRRLFDKNWNEETATSLERMTYGIVCFALFFSFLGTILGGIWADQSWGRFWGWDPKENGALMIVLWNAFILHARLGGHAARRTFMGMAVFGNVITSLSWFGVNMLGIGLHSYGFMDKAFNWLLIFVFSQCVIIALAAWPTARDAGETSPARPSR
jgi:ABC-type transport system involved in cytochrome c biogenesis permease subunit